VPPPAEYENWRANLVYQWLEYLDEGDLEGDHSVDGDLTATGNVTIGGAALSPLRLKENDAATHNAIVRVPSGWNAAASGDAVLDYPPQAYIPTGSEIAPTVLDNYTPTVTQGLSSITYTTQDGIYQRIGHVVYVTFALSWSAATTSGSNLIISLPISATLTVRGLDIPPLSIASAGAAHLSTGGSAGMYFCAQITNTNMGFRDAAGTNLSGTDVGTSNTITGSFTYWVSP
jgi:hypothetical protein